MEKVRIILAVVLSFGVFMLWDLFFIPKEQHQQLPPQQAKIESQQKQIQTEPYLPVQPSQTKVETKPIPVPAAEKPSRTIVVSTPLYSVDISENKASFKKLRLKKYRETVEPTSALYEMISSRTGDRNLSLEFRDGNALDLNRAVFKSDSTNNVYVSDSGKTLAFSWKSPDGIIIEKKYLFYSGSYKIDLNVIIKNGSQKVIKNNMLIPLVKYFPENSDRYSFAGPSAMINNNLEEIKLGSIEDKNIYSGSIKWAALQDRYFMSSIIPMQTNQSSPKTIRLSFAENRIAENKYSENLEIPPGTQQFLNYAVYFGPRSIAVLSSIGFDLDKSVNFGWFDFIAKPCLWLMNFIYKFIPNYGIAIIILTLITKILLFPLGTKSYKSMAEMKKIQPLMNEIRTKYKNDKKRMNQELMDLYRTYKVNPMSGCLPMILQIPIFFALYRMLFQAIELRHAPFFGWINDLSAPDRLFNFGFSVPFMEPPCGIPVLTIIMGATMFLQQKMSPPMGDPAQAKMMMFLPIIFTVIFINFSSGLVLYWLINNILSIAQQHYTIKKQSIHTKS